MTVCLWTAAESLSQSQCPHTSAPRFHRFTFHQDVLHAAQSHVTSVCIVCVSQDYISEFKFKSVVAQDLIDYFLSYFPELKDAAVAKREGQETLSAHLCVSSLLVFSVTSLPVCILALRSRV